MQIPDQIKVTFNDPLSFIGINGLQMEQEYQVFRFILPS
jgi:hypothetical protein